MATIPVNPERRDPGFLRKKADVGLNNVDNLSATDFINMVAEDVKIISNRKIDAGKISAEGKEYYIGILKTAELSSHVNFSTGLFNYSNPSRELAQFNVDFSYSTISAYDKGTLGYIIQVPENDRYLKDLELVFTQVGSIVYVTLYSKSLPTAGASNFFNQVGTDITEWTEGTVLLNATTNYADIVKGGIELGRFKLDSSWSTLQSEQCDSLPVYDKDGNRLAMEARNYPQAEIDNYDYPSINGVPFIAKKGMKVANKNNARNITVPAFHKGSSKKDAGGHDWEVFNDYRVIKYRFVQGPNYFGKPRTDWYYPDTTQQMTNNDALGFGLCRPTKYHTIPVSTTEYDIALNAAKTWLNDLGDDSDVVTVGALRVFMEFFMSQVLGNMKVQPEETERTETSYTTWNITISTHNDVDWQGNPNKCIDVSAWRNKVERIYLGDTLTDTKTTREEAGDSQITVVSENGFKVTKGGTGEWLVNVPENKTGGNWPITAYVDKGKTTQASIVGYIHQEAFDNAVETTNFSIWTFSTPTTISAAGGDKTVSYSILVEKTWTDGSKTSEYYNGSDVVIEVDNGATAQYKSPGNYTITYPENESTENTRTYTVTLRYENLEDTKTVVQSKVDVQDTIIGYDYYFYGDSLLNFPAISTELSANISSYVSEVHSLTGTIDTPIGFTVVSKPNWITSTRISGGKLYATSATNDTFTSNSGQFIELAQEDSGKKLSIEVTRESKSVEVVSNTWRFYSMNLSTSDVPLAGETRNLEVLFRNEIIYNTGDGAISYYSGKDIQITVIQDKETDVSDIATYDTSEEKFKLTFPVVSTPCTYEITATYKGITSPVKTIRQGDAKTGTDYVFRISDGNPYKNVPAIAGGWNIQLDSYSIDTYQSGNRVENTEDVIPFTYYVDDNCSWIVPTSSSNPREVALNFEANTGSTRNGTVTATQNGSGRTVKIYITQMAGSMSYYLDIDGTKYYDNDEIDIEFNNTSFNRSLTIIPVAEINGSTEEQDGTLVSVTESLSWLDHIYSPGTGNLFLYGPENTGGASRSGTVYIHADLGDGINVALNVFQKAGSPFINIEGSTGTGNYAVTKTKETQTFNLDISSNYEYTVTGSSDFATVVGETSKSAGESSLAFRLLENTTSSNRNATFTLTSDGGISRTITITQTSRDHFIDVVGFEGQDIYVTTSEWKPQIEIPLMGNVQFMIDYASDWLKVGITNQISSSFPYSDDCDYYTGYHVGVNSLTQYLHISPKDPSISNGEGVISLSYFDSDAGEIIAARKIYVHHFDKNRLNQGWESGSGYADYMEVLPYGPKEIFVSGEGGDINLYAYTKSSRFKVLVLNGDTDTGLEDATSDTAKGSSELTKLTTSIYENTTGKFREIEYTLVPWDNEPDSPASIHPVYKIYQYPKHSLEVYYIGVRGFKSDKITVSKDGDSVQILNDCYSSSGRWEIYSSSLPGWLTIDKPSAVNGAQGYITVKVQPNTELVSREAKIQFWCDSNYSTISTFTITQPGGSSDISSPEFDFSLLTATSTEQYLYVSGIKSMSVSGSIDTLGKTVSSITTNISKVSEGNYKLTYKLRSSNTYYNLDKYKVITIMGNDDQTRYIFLKNPRTSDINISIDRIYDTYGTFYANTIRNFVLTSNIGLTGFIQGTSFNSSNSVDFSSLETDSYASYKSNSANLHNPAKIFTKAQIMDRLYLRNMDVIEGYSRESAISLPEHTSSTQEFPGIGIYDDKMNTLIDIKNKDQVTTYTLTVPSKKGITTIYFRSYDGVTISTTNTGVGFTYTCHQPAIVKNVGSLGLVDFFITPASDNTTSSVRRIGYVTFTLPNGKQRIIYINQAADTSSVVGNTYTYGTSGANGGKCTDTEAYAICTKAAGETYGVTFVHEYPNWMFLNFLSVDNSRLPLFNSKTYSSTFGASGNSGTASSALGSPINGCMYRTAVNLTPGSSCWANFLPNNTFETSLICRLGITSSPSTTNISYSSNSKSFVNIITRPPYPALSLYNISNTLVKKSDGTAGTGSIVSAGLSSTISNGGINVRAKQYTVKFRLRSNYIEIAKNYIGRTTVLEDKPITISDEYDVFRNLLKTVTVTYTIDDTVYTAPVDFVFTTGEVDGESYAEFKSTFKLSTIATQPTKGNITVTLNDYVTNAAMYTPYPPATIIVPITFNPGLIIPEGGGTITPGGGGTITTCCFEGGSQVLTSLDGRSKSIESMKEGDNVVSYDPETGKNYLARVKRLITRPHCTDLLDVELENGYKVTMTDYHPLLTKEGWHSYTNFQGYDTLKVGDEVKTKDGWSKITKLDLYQKDVVTYTLNVIDVGENPDDDTNDNFYVNGICAHNALQEEFQCQDPISPIL